MPVQSTSYNPEDYNALSSGQKAQPTLDFNTWKAALQSGDTRASPAGMPSATGLGWTQAYNNYLAALNNSNQSGNSEIQNFYNQNPQVKQAMGINQIGVSQGQQQSSELYGNKQDLAGRYQDILQRRAQNLEQGASPAEVASMRAEGQQQGNNLMAQQGRAGISGGVAMAQQQNVQNKTADRVATANSMAREKALSDYSGDVGARLYGVESGGLNTANMLQRQLAAQKAGTQINMAY